jgi:hypothetical protein
LRRQSSNRIVEADGNKWLIKQASTGQILFSGVDDGEVLHPHFIPDGKRVTRLPILR